MTEPVTNKPGRRPAPREVACPACGSGDVEHMPFAGCRCRSCGRTGGWPAFVVRRAQATRPKEDAE